MRFRGRVAIVTGAGSGIGRCIAELLLEDGAHVTLFGPTRAKLEAVASRFAADSTCICTGRHEHPEDVREAVQRTAERWGRLDALFNNAGAYIPGNVAETPLAEWESQLAVNLTGPFLLTQAALPHLRRHRGAIVNIASSLGIKPVPGTAAYSVAKAGLVQLTRATALEEAQHGVRVNAICPGVVETPIHSRRHEDEAHFARFLEQAGKAHPLGRVGQPEEVAAMALFLIADESAWTTGSIVTVDGGISLG